MIRATFVMEQHIGHLTYYRNLRSFADQSGDVAASWVPVTYEGSAGAWERLPFLPRGLRGSLRGRAQVRRGLAQHAADVLFFNTQVPAALGGGMSTSRPYLISTDITPLQYDRMSHLYGHRPDRPGPLKWYKHQVNTRLLRGAARLLPWSSWAGQSLVRDYGVDPGRVEVVPPGVDLEQWRPGGPRPAGPLRILFVGGDLYRKGGETLLAAFRALPAGSAELHLVTRTAKDPEPGVQLYHDMQPNSPELVALYQRADLFALPSGAEAFGIAAVEASAAGLPVLATRVGGLTDIVADGETGFLTEAGDVGALAERLRLLAANPPLRQSMGAAARQRAEQRFNARKNTARILACVREAARARRQEPVLHEA